MSPVVFYESSRFPIVLFGWGRKHRKSDLRDFHSGTQNDGNVILVRYFERDVQKVSGVHDTCRVVDHEAYPSER